MHISKYYLLEQDEVLYLRSYSEESVAVSDSAALCINLVYSEDGRNPGDLTDCSLSLFRRQTPFTATRIPLRAFGHTIPSDEHVKYNALYCTASPSLASSCLSYLTLYPTSLSTETKDMKRLSGSRPTYQENSS